MATHLQTFLRDRMGVSLPIEPIPQSVDRLNERPTILLFSPDRNPRANDAFMIRVHKDSVWVQGDSTNGLRDGIVRLVDRMGFREAPFLQQGLINYEPRLKVRLGAVPTGGSYKDVVLFGLQRHRLRRRRLVRALAKRCYSRARHPPRTWHAGSESKRHERARQIRPQSVCLAQHAPEISEGRSGLQGASGNSRRAHLECRRRVHIDTSHPLVRRYLKEQIQKCFQSLPELQGVVLIIGGEGFYHCHMRPYGVAKGHTNCPRCEKLGAETAVADLCNDLASAARSVRPDAEVVLWPYSAEHVWAADFA